MFIAVCWCCSNVSLQFVWLWQNNWCEVNENESSWWMGTVKCVLSVLPPLNTFKACLLLSSCFYQNGHDQTERILDVKRCFPFILVRYHSLFFNLWVQINKSFWDLFIFTEAFFHFLFKSLFHIHLDALNCEILWDGWWFLKIY